MAAPAKYQNLLSALTRAEKASLMSGRNFWYTKPVERLGIPSIMLSDGPHGLRKQETVGDHLGRNRSIASTCFPTAATLANSWDTELLEAVGSALGAEAAAESIRVLLGPGLNIKRNPLAGRNFEYFSEDPLVSGKLAASFIRGVQSHGVSAAAKHFAVNSQESRRMTIDEIVDERALHEIYLEGFRIAVTEGGTWTVMSSYNRVNGTYANENRELLTNILRGRWGFDGLVVTDWGGNHDRVEGLLAGNALEMPSTDGETDRDILRALAGAAVDESVLDERVAEVLQLIDRTEPTEQQAASAAAHRARAGSGAAGTGSASAHLHAAHHELAVEAARRSIVLLENRHSTLPLAQGSAARVAVIGDFARTPRYQGAGSSLVNPTRLDSPLDALQESGVNIVGYAPGFSRRDSRSRRRARGALRLARESDIILLFLGLDESAESEGLDRSHMRLANNQLELANELLALGIPVVCVLAGGAPVELPFAEQAAAIVHGYLAGQGGGRAIADVLTGKVNPSGKLTESYPLRYEDVPSAPAFAQAEATAEHRESIYVGYRYFDKVDARVRYPFGHGLSYTSFSYSNLEPGAEHASVTVTNTGDVAGSEVVQLYVEAPDRAAHSFRAVRELRGFARVALLPGESRTVKIAYSAHAFDVFHGEDRDWRRIAGTYTIQAAASSRDIRLEAQLSVDADHQGRRAPHRTASADSASAGRGAPAGALSPHYVSGHVELVSAADFEGLIGMPLPPPNWQAGGPLTRAHTIEQGRGRGGFAGLLYFIAHRSRAVLLALGKPLQANNTRFILELP
ncbi:glycoside hydrolase family 3 C-terminal domain-containing protein [Leucobacter komagatae]|uniref:glycoside hydrolase family 3 C-terminal domain-containing protein n=1 Tax=Leucobacter komagatae TaxID=55969 RepID=UPI0006963F79|nr:glycoside hydrolase family 3 C-terminal domain-containing protein [Leucobacter komagatae]